MKTRGMTLLEVMLALTLLAMALAAIGQLVSNGVRSATQARLQTQAILRCEAKLAEVLAGAEPLEPCCQSPYRDDPAWTWSLYVTRTPRPGLIDVQITVVRAQGPEAVGTSYTLTRWMFVPTGEGKPAQPIPTP
jgi:type II secretion system protein I